MSAGKRRWADAAAFAVLLVAVSFAQAQTAYPDDPPRPIAVEARPIVSFDNRDPSRVRFGDLEFRGGLELVSHDKVFGGLSSLRVSADGQHFLSLSDKARWFRGRLLYSNGKLGGVSDMETAPMLGGDGKPLRTRGWYDTESLAEDGGTLYVGIERVEQIVRFDYGRDGLLARGRPIPVPPDFKTLKYNKSLECLVMPPKGMPLAGTLIAVTEQSLDKDGNHRSFLLKGATAGRFSVKRTGDFDVSDCAVMPPGDLLLLERHFSIARGILMRIRRIPLAQVKPGALLDGRVMIEADLGYQIDNMEGLAVHRNADGEILFTLVSDDNFSVLQRTLLLQFAVVGE